MNVLPMTPCGSHCNLSSHLVQPICLFRGLVKNLIHGYLTAPTRKKGEVLRLIANILGFSEQDVAQVGVTAT